MKNEIMINKVYKSINGCSLEQIEKFIEQDVETELSTELNIYVCFDGNAKIYYKGDLAHCYMYSKMFRRHNDFDLEISSIEKYNEMMEEIKKI